MTTSSSPAQPARSPQNLLRWLLECVALSFVFAVLYRIGLSFAFQQEITLVRPTAGFALAVLILLGYRRWPAIAGGALLAHWLGMTETTPAGAVVGLSIADTI
ncbi:MAG: hypothetical protein KDA60_01525, partial [Planctomycetales bacterium]|nr:hypothetical protein [Planctomycetales bacterium]